MPHTVRLTKATSNKVFETNKPIRINFRLLRDSGELPAVTCNILQYHYQGKRVLFLGIDAGRFAIGIETDGKVFPNNVFYLSQQLAAQAIELA